MQTGPKISDWDQYYIDETIESMPWFYENLDHDFKNALEKLKLSKKSVLDIGTGPGTQAIEMAKLGFDVTAIDISEAAVIKADFRSKREGVKVTFLRDNILETRIQQTFDIIIDRGCYHVHPPEKRKSYSDILNNLLAPGGYLFLKCFSHLEPGSEGPYRSKPEDIQEAFSSNFKIQLIEDSYFEGNRKPLPQALFCILKKPEEDYPI